MHGYEKAYILWEIFSWLTQCEKYSNPLRFGGVVVKSKHSCFVDHISVENKYTKYFFLFQLICSWKQYIHSFVRSFVRACMHSFMHSFIHSFIHLFIDTGRKHDWTKVNNVWGYSRVQYTRTAFGENCSFRKLVRCVSVCFHRAIVEQ